MQVPKPMHPIRTSRWLPALTVLIYCMVTFPFMVSCKKKGPAPAEQPTCYNAQKVNAAYTKVKKYLAEKEPAYKNGTLPSSEVGLYIDILATYERMDYYINIVALGPGVKVTNDDGSQFTIDELLVMNYKEALCNETDDVNKKL